MKLKILILLFCLFTPSLKAMCPELNVVQTFTGKLHRQKFAGPPNYESIQHGDQPETYWVLNLDEPLCDFITQLQIILLPQDYKNYKRFLRKPVILKGKLHQAETGHHHTPFLIELENTPGAIQKNI